MLLMVMVLQMGVRVAHTHHHQLTEQVECSDCEHNRVHSGHLLSWDGEQDDCILCQILATPFLPADEVQCADCAYVRPLQFFGYTNDVVTCDLLGSYLRGPPYHIL